MLKEVETITEQNTETITMSSSAAQAVQPYSCRTQT